MTDKRFNRVGGYVYDKDKCISHFDDVKHRDEIIDLLNKLHEENEQLKFDKTNLHQCMSKDRVKYNQFKDKVFCCIDKKIKLLKDCFMSNEAKILEDLKKEICDLE